MSVVGLDAALKRRSSTRCLRRAVLVFDLRFEEI
jgi:hypothetical protein